MEWTRTLRVQQQDSHNTGRHSSHFAAEMDNSASYSQPGVAARRAADKSVTPPTTDQQLISDFKHLALSVREDSQDNGPQNLSAAQIAARAAYTRHSVDEGISGSKPLNRKPDIDDLHEASVSSQQATPTKNFSQDEDRAQRYANSDDRRRQADLDYRDPASEIPSHPDTKDVTVAKPVTHETIRRHNHEIRQEVIERDIHEYHEITRIQPVIERVVLPARHFIETADGRKVEIPAPTTALPAGYSVGTTTVQSQVPGAPASSTTTVSGPLK